MAISLDPKQIVSFEELLMSQVTQQEALTRLLVERRIFTKEGFWEMVEERDHKIIRFATRAINEGGAKQI